MIMIICGIFRLVEEVAGLVMKLVDVAALSSETLQQQIHLLALVVQQHEVGRRRWARGRLLGEYDFDGMFILKWCLVNGIIRQKQIMNGIKIMQMDICNLILGIKLRIRCSYWKFR
ncbi:hypothetical protein BV898_19444 [Hypsibius exemplaris]|uniref:Secreted protein n=1 Tax=Hypsibius exemplaris TaxID=2072580 RepID=A0A9X6NS75_HYPEX|nr:hypothetical protein BV898_19444 [Hypsibius exemplaris]